MPSPDDLFAQRPGDDLGVSEAEDHAVGPGAKPQGVWRLSPEDEAKCYINVQLLNYHAENFRFVGGSRMVIVGWGV